MLGDIADARSDYRAYLENSPDNAIFRQDVFDALDRLDR
jgi:hypothetical protein